MTEIRISAPMVWSDWGAQHVTGVIEQGAAQAPARRPGEQPICELGPSVCDSMHGMGRKAYRHRCYPNEDQAPELARTFDCVRYVYNGALALCAAGWCKRHDRINDVWCYAGWCPCLRAETQGTVLAGVSDRGGAGSGEQTECPGASTKAPHTVCRRYGAQ